MNQNLRDIYRNICDDHERFRSDYKKLINHYKAVTSRWDNILDEADYITSFMFWAHENEDYLDVITNKYLRLWALAGMGGGGTYATVRKR